jgi:hypothetical protein
MDLKMRQYEQGKAFCDGVVALGGIDALNRVWAGPDAMPSMAGARRSRCLARAPSLGACARAPDARTNPRSDPHKVRAFYRVSRRSGTLLQSRTARCNQVQDRAYTYVRW